MPFKRLVFAASLTAGIRSLLAVTALLMLSSFSAMPARAHSLQQLETQLQRQEKFFQPVGRLAPEFDLQDSEGHPWDLDRLRGKVVVLNFIYAGCKDLCPLHSELIAELQKMINLTPMRDQVQFVSITTDPGRDGSDVLKAYGAAHGLDPSNWTFLTTRPGQPEDATRRLAERFGHKFTRTDDGEYAHGIVTHVIDRDGMMRGNFHTLKFEPTNLVMFVNALANDVHKPGHAEDGAAGIEPSGRDAHAAASGWISLVPVALLVLAAGWLMGAITFFGLRRMRSRANARRSGSDVSITDTRRTGR